jgi:hypothetical protein
VAAVPANETKSVQSVRVSAPAAKGSGSGVRDSPSLTGLDAGRGRARGVEAKRPSEGEVAAVLAGDLGAVHGQRKRAGGPAGDVVVHPVDAVEGFDLSGARVRAGRKLWDPLRHDVDGQGRTALVVCAEEPVARAWLRQGAAHPPSDCRSPITDRKIVPAL